MENDHLCGHEEEIHLFVTGVSHLEETGQLRGPLQLTAWFPAALQPLLRVTGETAGP